MNTEIKSSRREWYFTMAAGQASEDQACQLFLRYSLHLEDLVCWQILAIQHLLIHPETKMIVNCVIETLAKVFLMFDPCNHTQQSLSS